MNLHRKIIMIVALVFWSALGYGQKYSNGKVPTGDKSRIGPDVLRKGTKPNQILMTLGDSTVKYVDADTVGVITRSYKVYTALLTQSGTSAPTALVLENTLGGVPVWTRTGGGVYTCTLSGAFIDEKTAIFFSLTGTSGDAKLIGYVVAPNEVIISTTSGNDYETEDGYLTIEIRVYN